jgi:iron complex outermembrane receptor protein
VAIPDQTKNLYSAFLQDEINLLSDRLWLTLGTKYEHNDFTGNEWQPGARLLWKPATDHSLWAAVSRAVRTPSMVEKNGALTVGVYPLPDPFGPQPVYLLGTADFDSETLIAYETGYRWQARKNISLDVALYYNDYDDLYTTVPSTTSPFDLLFMNAKRGEGHGVEIAANWQAYSWLSLILTYTWQELSIDWQDPLSAGTIDYNYSYAKNMPRRQVSLRSVIDLDEHWQLNGWLRYTDTIYGRDSTDQENSIPVSDYFLLDANLIWKPRKNLEIMLAGQNLLNSSQLEYVSEYLIPPTEIERSIYGKITWSF